MLWWVLLPFNLIKLLFENLRLLGVPKARHMEDGGPWCAGSWRAPSSGGQRGPGFPSELSAAVSQESASHPAAGAGGQAILSGPVSEPTEPQRHRLLLGWRLQLPERDHRRRTAGGGAAGQRRGDGASPAQPLRAPQGGQQHAALTGGPGPSTPGRAEQAAQKQWWRAEAEAPLVVHHAGGL